MMMNKVITAHTAPLLTGNGKVRMLQVCLNTAPTAELRWTEGRRRDTGMKPIIDIIQKEISMSIEDNVVKAVQEVGIVVDKDRLVKALYDAMSFYREGYNDGMLVNPCVHGEWIHNTKREYDYICSVCRVDAPEDRYLNNAILTPYCPHCGAVMDGGNRNADA